MELVASCLRRVRHWRGVRRTAQLRSCVSPQEARTRCISPPRRLRGPLPAAIAGMCWKSQTTRPVRAASPCSGSCTTPWRAAPGRSARPRESLDSRPDSCARRAASRWSRHVARRLTKQQQPSTRTCTAWQRRNMTARSAPSRPRRRVARQTRAFPILRNARRSAASQKHQRGSRSPSARTGRRSASAVRAAATGSAIRARASGTGVERRGTCIARPARAPPRLSPSPPLVAGHCMQRGRTRRGLPTRTAIALGGRS